MDASGKSSQLSCFYLSNRKAPEIVAENETIVVFLNIGSKFANNSNFSIGENEFDALSIKMIESFIATNELVLKKWIYPKSEDKTSLNDIINYFDIPEPSPLGIRVSKKYGSWWAFRGIIRIEGNHEFDSLKLGESACVDCSTKACIDACPSGALAAEALPDMQRCAMHRLKNNSSCFNTCLARVACPYGKSYRYSDKVLHYLYINSIEGLKTWLALNTKN